MIWINGIGALLLSLVLIYVAWMDYKEHLRQTRIDEERHELNSSQGTLKREEVEV